jgi:hypothetical protein
MSALGFTVAADAKHPFGTENACVFFSDGTYLEPLAIGEPGTYSAFDQAENAFVTGDRRFRERRGQDGFSALVAKSDDADRDHARFVSMNMSGGDAFSFRRPVTLPDGSTAEASFRLAFANDHNDSDFFFFTCQRIAALPADRSSLERHDNGVTGIREIVLSADRPSDFEPLVEAVFETSSEKDHEGRLFFVTASVRLSIVTNAPGNGLADKVLQPADSSLSGQGIVFSVSDLAVTAALLTANGVEYTRKGARLLVPTASGQGAIFAFEE